MMCTVMHTEMAHDQLHTPAQRAAIVKAIPVLQILLLPEHIMKDSGMMFTVILRAMEPQDTTIQIKFSNLI